LLALRAVEVGVAERDADICIQRLCWCLFKDIRKRALKEAGPDARVHTYAAV
jgi:hypothetical protein